MANSFLDGSEPAAATPRTTWPSARTGPGRTCSTRVRRPVRPRDQHRHRGGAQLDLPAQRRRGHRHLGGRPSVYVGIGSYPNNNLGVISTATNAVTSSITVTGPINSLLTAMAINPAGTEMFITLQAGVAVVSLTSQRTIAFIPLTGSEGIAVNPNGSAAYATNGFVGGAAQSNTVTAISTSTNTVTRTYSGMTEPTNLTVNPAGTEAYVTCIGAGNTPFITGINLSNGSETNLSLPTTDDGNDLAVSPNGNTLYVSFNSIFNPDGVFEINTSNLQIAATLSPDGQYATDDTIRPFGAAPVPPVIQPMSVTTASLPGAVKGQYYSTTLAAIGGLAPYSWQSTGATLPAGLTLSPTGTLYRDADGVRRPGEPDVQGHRLELPDGHGYRHTLPDRRLRLHRPAALRRVQQQQHAGVAHAEQLYEWVEQQPERLCRRHQH